MQSGFTFLLLLGGDIELNPGPKPQDIFPCGYCELPVSFSHIRAICCDECDIWYHSACIELSSARFEHLCDSNVDWLCGKCHSHNYTYGLFHSYEFEISNYYNPLSRSQLSHISICSDENVFDPNSHSSPKSIMRSPNEPQAKSTPKINASCRVSRISPAVASTSNPRLSRASTTSNTSGQSQRQLPSKQANWRTLIINCNGITGKRAELAQLADYTDPDAMLLCETKLDGSVNNAEFLPEGYKAYRKDRVRGGGGVLIAIKNKYCSEQVNVDGPCEQIWAKVKLRGQRAFFLCSFYRPPNSKTDQLDAFDLSLGQINHQAKGNTVMFGGDFNVGDVDWESGTIKADSPTKAICARVLDIFSYHGLEQQQKEPTRQNRVLELFCTNKPGLTKNITTIPGISDHEATVLVDSNLRPPYSKKPKRKIYLYAKADWNKIKADCLAFQSSFLATHTDSSVEECWVAIKQYINNVMTDNIPSKLTSVRYNLPWLTNELKRQCRKKHRYYNRAKKTKKASDWTKFQNLKRELAQAIRQAHIDYVNGILEDSLDEGNPRPFWRYIKSQKQDNFGIAPLKHHGEIRSDSKGKAEALSDQFKSVFSKQHEGAIPTLPGPAFQHINRLQISVDGVTKLLQQLKVNKASGPDDIPCRILKELAIEISPVITFLFRKSIDTGDLPQDWLKANIAPVFKKGDRHSAANYRPVSLTCVLCKSVEHIIVKHLNKHLDKYDILTKFQHGFRRSRSCETQLLVTLHDLLLSWDNNARVDMAVLDFEKAFDKVPHDHLLYKLDYYGIRGPIKDWISSFLKNRTQSVLVEGESSDPVSVDSGVPQGTVLGPIMFLIFINDLPNLLSADTKVRLFADDCLVYRQIRNQEDHTFLQMDLDLLHRWSHTWGMRFNARKCEIMTIARAKSTLPHFYNLGGEILSNVENIKYLGTTITNNLTWATHIESITRKANSTLGFLRRNLRRCPQSLKTRAYLSMVRSTLEYSSSVWDPYLKGDIHKVERIQRLAARFIKGDFSFSSSVTDMLNELGLQSLEDRRRQARLVLLFKVLVGEVAITPEEAFGQSLSRADARTRGADALKFKSCSSRTTNYNNSFLPRTVRDWNALDPTIRCSTSITSFKSGLSRLGLRPNCD